jgi:hypothetical protein
VTLAASVPDTWIGTLMAAVRRSTTILAVDGAHPERRPVQLRRRHGHDESSGGQSLPSAPVDWPALAIELGIAHVERVGDVAGLRAAFLRAHAARGPALLVLDGAFDPSEPIPPYSERPDEIRARFKIA